MYLTYTPEGEPEQRFTWRPRELASVEAEMIEEVGGNTWQDFDEFAGRFMRDNQKARRAALWILLRRTDPKLRFVDLGYVKVGEISVGYEPDELAKLRATIEEDANLTDAEKAELLADIDAGAAVPADVEPEPAGKDDSGDSTTGSPSPLPVSPAE